VKEGVLAPAFLGFSGKRLRRRPTTRARRRKSRWLARRSSCSNTTRPVTFKARRWARLTRKETSWSTTFRNETRVKNLEDAAEAYIATQPEFDFYDPAQVDAAVEAVRIGTDDGANSPP
jgi:hypothetical protein